MIRTRDSRIIGSCPPHPTEGRICERGPKSTMLRAGSTLDFIVRPLEERDLPACLQLLRGHLAYPASILPEVPKVWRRLLRDDAVVTAVAEGGRLDTKPGSILAFGVVVFVTDAWMAASRAGQRTVPVRAHDPSGACGSLADPAPESHPPR